MCEYRNGSNVKNEAVSYNLVELNEKYIIPCSSKEYMSRLSKDESEEPGRLGTRQKESLFL
jgi:hypothetical protein